MVINHCCYSFFHFLLEAQKSNEKIGQVEINNNRINGTKDPTLPD